jgi:hypothetical protein
VKPIGPHEDPWPERAGATRWIADEVVDAELFLAGLITDGIRDDPDVRAQDIVVTVQNGVVILGGRVPDDRTRDAALRRARGIPGVFDVCCLLSVEPGRT